MTNVVCSSTSWGNEEMIKNLTIISLIFIIVVAATWIYDVVSDQNHEIAILKPIPLLEKAPQDYPASNRETGKISVGEQVKVLRMGYGKDFRTWKVRGSVGQEGWFIEENDSIKFKNNGK